MMTGVGGIARGGGSVMTFALTEGRMYSATDPNMNSHMVINTTKEIEFLAVVFTSPDVSLKFMIMLRSKFPDRPVVKNDPSNPGLMILAGDLQLAFAAKKMRDIEANTRLTESLIRMIAFINKHYPLATSPFLWSDYEKTRQNTFLFRMPSDEVLLRLSLEPEQELSGRTGG
jgi:hypothetical protein